MQHPEGKITGLRIPDEDMSGWIKTLYEAGFSQEEMDKILSHLNQTYAEKVDKGMNDLNWNVLEDRIGRPLTDAERAQVKKAFEDGLNYLGVKGFDVDLDDKP